MDVNVLINGDCISEMKKIPDNSVDLIFADPPYNLQLDINKVLYRRNGTKIVSVKDKWDSFSSFEEYDTFSEAWIKECQRILKPTGSFWVIGSYHNIFRIGKILQDLNFWILNDVIWVKKNPLPQMNGTRFCNAHETLIWAQKKKNKEYTFNYELMKRVNNGKQMRSDWLFSICLGPERLRHGNGDRVHSTQKPENLIERILLATSNENDLVLDPFAGSGTTIAVAKKHGRKWIGIEKDKKYIPHIKKRLSKIKKSKKISDFFVQG